MSAIRFSSSSWRLVSASRPTLSTIPVRCSATETLAAAISTYNRCIDDLALIPGCSPVAFRMPCCDSMNSLSPRFFDLIFNTVTPGGRHLRADSSVFHLFTSEDPVPAARARPRRGRSGALREVRSGGRRSFVNTIENHPYPYVIDRLCWEFPAAVPSDWEAQHRHGVCNPRTVTDLCAGIDATVGPPGRLHPLLPSRRLDPQPASGRDRPPRGHDTRSEGEVPHLA